MLTIVRVGIDVLSLCLLHRHAPFVFGTRDWCNNVGPSWQCICSLLQVRQPRLVPLVHHVQQSSLGPRVPLQLTFRRTYHFIVLQRWPIGQRRCIGLLLVPFEQGLFFPHCLEGTEHLVHNTTL